MMIHTVATKIEGGLDAKVIASGTFLDMCCRTVHWTLSKDGELKISVSEPRKNCHSTFHERKECGTHGSITVFGKNLKPSTRSK